MGEFGPGRPPVEYQFKPGHPGGPGRPMGSKSLKKMIREKLQEKDGELAQLVVDRLVENIKSCDLRRLKMLIDHSD